MENELSIHIEDHSTERVVSFSVNCAGPEEAAWNLMRDWAVANAAEYQSRRYIGCAPKGHHPKGQEHHADEIPDSHEYMAQMFLKSDEGNAETFRGAHVIDAPQGFFLVGDVALDKFGGDGRNVDIGTSMQKTFGVMSGYLKEMGCYEFDLNTRPYFEEHIFENDWFDGNGNLAGFKLWLPVRKV